MEASASFLALSRRYLCQEYPAKLRLALDRLPPEDLWWQPGPGSNSVGVLLLHLAGNVRQWIVSGVGGAEDVRARADEFAATGGMDLDEVWAILEKAVADADRVLAGLDPTSLGRRLSIQGLEVECMEAIYHVVEHFSMHTGQILWIVKARTDQDLGFYEVDEAGKVIGTRW